MLIVTVFLCHRVGYVSALEGWAPCPAVFVGCLAVFSLLRCGVGLLSVSAQSRVLFEQFI